MTILEIFITNIYNKYTILCWIRLSNIHLSKYWILESIFKIKSRFKIWALKNGWLFHWTDIIRFNKSICIDCSRAQLDIDNIFRNGTIRSCKTKLNSSHTWIYLIIRNSIIRFLMPFHSWLNWNLLVIFLLNFTREKIFRKNKNPNFFL